VRSGISGGTERLVYRGGIPADLALDDTIGALGGACAYGYACVDEVGGSGEMVFAFHLHQDVFAARATELVPLPGVDPVAATLFALAETALQVTLDAGTGYRDRVVVLSVGVLGLLTALLMQRGGGRPLIAELVEWRRRVAGSLGAAGAAPEDFGSERVPLVIDASGNPDVPAMALEMLAHEGALLIGSWFRTKPAVLSLGGAFHRRRLTIRSTQVSTVSARLSETWTVTVVE
jgi:threonine dehydrogenase-like Zn-dependent dehydrogenase